VNRTPQSHEQDKCAVRSADRNYPVLQKKAADIASSPLLASRRANAACAAGPHIQRALTNFSTIPMRNRRHPHRLSSRNCGVDRLHGGSRVRLMSVSVPAREAPAPFMATLDQKMLTRLSVSPFCPRRLKQLTTRSFVSFDQPRSRPRALLDGQLRRRTASGRRLEAMSSFPAYRAAAFSSQRLAERGFGQVGRKWGLE
jgi:hypothetical protein